MSGLIFECVFDCQHYKADRESEKERSEREGATLIIMLCKYTTDCAHYEAVRVCVCVWGMVKESARRTC